MFLKLSRRSPVVKSSRVYCCFVSGWLKHSVRGRRVVVIGSKGSKGSFLCLLVLGVWPRLWFHCADGVCRHNLGIRHFRWHKKCFKCVLNNVFSLCWALYVCVSVWLPACLPACLSVCVSVCVYLCLCLALALSASVSVCLSVSLCLSLSLSVCLSLSQSPLPPPFSLSQYVCVYWRVCICSESVQVVLRCPNKNV